MPSNEYLCGLQYEADPYRIECNKIALCKNIALYMESELLSQYLVLLKDFPEYKIDVNSIGVRALKNLCLEMLLIGNHEKYFQLAVDQFYKSNNLTDEYGALLPFVKYSCEGYEKLLDYFYIKNSNHEKIVDMWISLYAIQIPNAKIDIIERLKNLIKNKDIRLNNFSRINSLLQTYFYENPLSFHDPSCVGYNFWSETILILDKINPSLASQGARVLMNWRSLKISNKIHIESLLRSMLSEHKLSDNLEEVLSKMLKY
jgi:aminopeptidase N